MSKADLVPLSAIEVIKYLHVGEGAAVTLHRKLGGEWQDLGAIMSSELHRRWPLIKTHLVADSYFSINSTYEQKRAVGISEVTGLPIYSRKAERLRWLNAAVVDIDRHHDTRVSFETLLESFMRQLAPHCLPAPNLVVSSGRGIWVLWSLRDHLNLHTPVPAFRERRDIHRRVNTALVKAFATLGADPESVDPSRVMRVPDSTNTAAAPENSIVQFFRWSNNVHTLPELAGMVGVGARKVWFTGEHIGPKSEARVKAAIMRWRIPLEGFDRLWNMRRHFDKGVRHSALWVYALLLRRNRVPDPEIFEKCLGLAKSCRPELNVEDVRRCVAASAKAARKPFHESVSNATLARMLMITDVEKAALPDWFRPPRERKATRIATRRKAIMGELQMAGQWCADRDHWLSAREIVRLLAEKHGIRVSHVTVLDDCQLLHRRHFDSGNSFAQAPFGRFSVLVQRGGVEPTSKENLPPPEYYVVRTRKRVVPGTHESGGALVRSGLPKRLTSYPGNYGACLTKASRTDLCSRSLWGIAKAMPPVTGIQRRPIEECGLHTGNATLAEPPLSSCRLPSRRDLVLDAGGARHPHLTAVCETWQRRMRRTVLGNAL